VHSAASHPCNEEHPTIKTDMKWHPHGSCEDLKTESERDHQHTTPLVSQSFFGQGNLTISSISFPILQEGHSERFPDSLNSIFLAHNMLAATVFLI